MKTEQDTKKKLTPIKVDDWNNENVCLQCDLHELNDCSGVGLALTGFDCRKFKSVIFKKCKKDIKIILSKSSMSYKTTPCENCALYHMQNCSKLGKKLSGVDCQMDPQIIFKYKGVNDVEAK